MDILPAIDTGSPLKRLLLRRRAPSLMTNQTMGMALGPIMNIVPTIDTGTPLKNIFLTRRTPSFIAIQTLRMARRPVVNVTSTGSTDSPSILQCTGKDPVGSVTFQTLSVAL
eukprot:scaffold22642_cov134-Cylindrotheca_fusiformis.AAC.30